MHGGSYILFWLLTYILCTIPDIANTLHSLKHAIRPRLLPTITAKSAISNFNREMFALFLHFTIPNTHTDEPQTSYPSSPQHSNFNPSRTLHSWTNYMETTNPTTIATTNPKGLIEAREEWGYLSINPSFSTISTNNDDMYEGILWIQLLDNNAVRLLVYALCYVPPSNSSWWYTVLIEFVIPSKLSSLCFLVMVECSFVVTSMLK